MHHLLLIVSVLRRLQLPWLLLGTLILASGFAVAMLAARVLYSGRGWHVYLVWNLILAWLPLAFAVTFHVADGPLPRLRALRFACGCGWLVFLPNAPYLVTDFVHLVAQPPVPLWFDILLLMTFAWTGVMLGFVSLRLMQERVVPRWGERAGQGFVVVALALASFGIYLGRFQRFNSWSVLNRPLEVFGDMAHRLFVPWEHPRTWGFTACCFGFLLLAYVSWAGGQRKSSWAGSGACD